LLVARVLIFLLAVVSGVAAQPATDDLQPNESPDDACALSIAPPDAPSAAAKPPRVIDKKFIIVMSALGVAESLRFTTRTMVVEREFAAGAPWISSTPSHPHLIAKNAALYASELLVAYEMKKPHDWLPGDRIIRKFWWAYPAVMTALHIKNAIGNIRTQGPGGCTSIDCAMQIP
jgi:hypothetical protein